jgi:hypothetical protein
LIFISKSTAIYGIDFQTNFDTTFSWERNVTPTCSESFFKERFWTSQNDRTEQKGGIMAVIKVIAKISNTYHPKYGALVAGQEYQIDEQDFGDEIFERVKNKEIATPSARNDNLEIATPSARNDNLSDVIARSGATKQSHKK